MSSDIPILDMQWCYKWLILPTSIRKENKTVSLVSYPIKVCELHLVAEDFSHAFSDGNGLVDVYPVSRVDGVVLVCFLGAITAIVLVILAEIITW